MRLKNTEQQRAFIIKVIYLAFLSGIVYLVLKYALGLLMPFIIGYAMAMLFNPLIRFLSDKLHVKKRSAAICVVFLGYAIVLTLLILAITRSAIALGAFFADAPKYFNDVMLPAIRNMLGSINEYIDRLPEEWQVTVASIESNLYTTLINLVSSVSTKGIALLTAITKSLPSFLFGLIFTILASFYINIHFDSLKRFLSAQLQEKTVSLLHDIKDSFINTIGRYLRAYIKILCITFVELNIGFFLLGISNSVLIALLISIFDILPVFGTGGILIPWIIITLISGNTMLALGLLILYVIVTMVRNFIEPKIVGDQLGLNPIVSLIAMYLGFRVLGVFGLFLVPISTQIAVRLHKDGKIHLYNAIPQETSEPAEGNAEAKPAEKKDAGFFGRLIGNIRNRR